jgi:hypothetical protein
LASGSRRRRCAVIVKDLRQRLAASVLLLLFVALGVRVAAWLLAPAVPWLLALAAFAALYLLVIRRHW